MNVAVELDDDLARALLALTGKEELEEAVVIAVESFVRRERLERGERLERLRALKGKVDMLSNEELEAADLKRAIRLWGDPLPDEAQDEAVHSHAKSESRTALMQRLKARYGDLEGSLADELIAERRKEARDEG